MTMATPMKTSFENQHLRSCDYFAIVPSPFDSTMLVKYATNGPQGTPFKQILRIKELLLHHMLTDVVVKTANVLMSLCCFADDDIDARATRLSFTIRPIKFLICDVVIPVAVVDAP